MVLKQSKKLYRLIEKIKDLNKLISDDSSLGQGFQIGHSYFCTKDFITDSWLKSVVEYEIIPLIKEYWFDDVMKVNEWSKILREAIKW